MLARKADRLLAHTFHQAAVPGDDIGVVVHHLGTPARAQRFLGHGETNSIGNALTQGACRGLHARDMAELRVTGRDRAPLAEVLDLLKRHIGIAGQVQQRIDQHRAMARRKDEPIPIRPARGGGIEFQVVLKQDGGNIGHAHRHPGMAGIGGGNRIKGQCANGTGFVPVVRVLGAEGSNIQGFVLRWAMIGPVQANRKPPEQTPGARDLRLNSRPGGKIKHVPQRVDVKGGRISLWLWGKIRKTRCGRDS